MSEGATAGIEACVFDAYGMLFDVHSAIKRGGVVLGEKAPIVSALWRQKQLEYAWNSEMAGVRVDFWRATSEALDYALLFHGIKEPGLSAQLLNMYMSLEAYPDVVPCLKILRARGLTNAILSNGTPAMLEAAATSAGLDTLMDAVLSVEEVGTYKPRPRAYQLAVDRLGLSPNQICFISTNGWDVSGASVFGYHVVWHNRFNQPPEGLPGKPTAVITSLDELPRLLGSGFSQG